MQKFLFMATVSTILLLAACHASAEDGGWSGSGELGLANASGNTQSTTFVARLGLAREDERWKHAVGASFQYGKSDGVENARRYELFGSSGYRLGERSYVLGSLRNERDRFSGDEYQWTAGIGYGYEAIKSDETQLTFEVGPGYRWSKLQDLRVHNNEAVFRGAMQFAHRFNDTTSFYDNLLVEAGQENTFLRNELGLEVKMSNALALKAGLEVRHNTEVPPGSEKTDTLTTVNLVYGF